MKCPCTICVGKSQEVSEIKVSLLNGERILPNDIEVAKGLLLEFVTQLDNFYEVRREI